MATSTKKLILVNASSLTSAGCFRKYWLSSIVGLRSKEPNSVQVEYGSAFHIFKQVLKTHKNSDLATHCAINYFTETPHTISKGKEWYNRLHLQATCEEYLKQPQDNFETLTVDGKPLVEQTVSIPYYADDLIEVILCGTMDDIGKIAGGCFAIADTKTTGTWNHREYFTSYELSHQLMFYRLLVDWLAEHKGGIWKDICRSRVGSAINAAFLTQDKPTVFERSPIYFYSERQMSDFKNILDHFIFRLRMACSSIQKDELPLPEGILTQTCQGRFDSGKCQFWKACAAPDEIARDHILRAMFKTEEYNPMKFRSLTPEIESMLKAYESRNSAAGNATT